MLEFLEAVEFIDLYSLEAHKIKYSDVEKQVLVSQSDRNLLSSLKSSTGEDRESLLKLIRDQELSKDDLDLLTGRRTALSEFCCQLYKDKNWDEPKWQRFFNINTWIFGYGLDYQFLSILQREAKVSDSNLTGKGTVATDFLAGTENFTVIVEIKRPDIPLFRATSVQRALAWGLSHELTDATSQILTQKAAWQIKSQSKNYADSGKPIQQGTIDPKCILIIGSGEQFKGITEEAEIKSKTFELFRRDSRNIEIITYDELFKRAYFLVNQKLPDEGSIADLRATTDPDRTTN